MKKIKTLVVLSVLLLTFGCMKEEEKTTAATPAVVKSITNNWVKNQFQVQFGSGTYDGQAFNALITTNANSSPTAICSCFATLTGTNSGGVFVLSTCTQVHGTSVNPNCSQVENAFDSGAASYTNVNGELDLIQDDGTSWIGKLTTY